MKKKVKYNKANKSFMDQDYWDKLSTEDKQWLNQFNKEYYEAIYSEDERVLHGEQYDEELKEARSARRKDLWNSVFPSHRSDDGSRNHVENNMDIYEQDKGIWYEDDDIDKLKKVDESKALGILREQALDSINNEVDTIQSILSDFQRDSLIIFINARKNK